MVNFLYEGGLWWGAMGVENEDKSYYDYRRGEWMESFSSKYFPGCTSGTIVWRICSERQQMLSFKNNPFLNGIEVHP